MNNAILATFYNHHRNIMKCWINNMVKNILKLAQTIEPVLKDFLIGYKNVVAQTRWSWLTSSLTLKCKICAQECVVF